MPRRWRAGAGGRRFFFPPLRRFTAGYAQPVVRLVLGRPREGVMAADGGADRNLLAREAGRGSSGAVEYLTLTLMGLEATGYARG